MKKLISILLAIVLLTSVMTVGVAEKKKTTEFTGKLSVKAATLVKPGSVVKLQARVKKANLAYTINWEQYIPDKDEWEKIAEDKDCCVFEAEETGVFVFRAALKAEDGSKLYKKVKITVRESFTEEEAAAEEAEAEEEEEDSEETAPAEKPAAEEKKEAEAKPAPAEKPAAEEKQNGRIQTAPGGRHGLRLYDLGLFLGGRRRMAAGLLGHDPGAAGSLRPHHHQTDRAVFGGSSR